MNPEELGDFYDEIEQGLLALFSSCPDGDFYEPPEPEPAAGTRTRTRIRMDNQLEIRLERGNAGIPVMYVDGKKTRNQAKAFRTIVRKLGLSQSELGRLVGKSPRTVAKYFLRSGPAAIPAEVLVALKIELDGEGEHAA